MTRLTVSIMVESLDQAPAQAAIAAEHGADLVEYRIDPIVQAEQAEPDDIEAMVRDSPRPCIVTCRLAEEGGDYRGGEAARRAMLSAACLGGAAYIDVELAAFERDPAWAALAERFENRTGLILSAHDFERRPTDLLQKVEKMAVEPRCRVIKVAWMARSLRDNLEAFELMRNKHKPTVALCMGEFGAPSRLLAGKFGGLLTFAGLDDETVTAPGQVGAATMKRLYRWDAIQPDTAVYGVIGWPVAHSMSPAIHNAGFDAVDHDGVYLLMPIPPEYEPFKATVGAWLDDKALNFRGASVTIPHKENLIRFVAERGGEVEGLARRIGAANTLTVRDDGALHASNTDYAAAIDSVCGALGCGRDEMAGRRVAVIGAGGAARAIVAGFANHGATVVVYNRTVGRAEQLAEEFSGPNDGPARAKVVAAPLDNLCKSCCDVYINCTPIGMHPNVDATPMERWPDGIGKDTVVFDTIYNPVRTKLLRTAREAGATTISGVDMFVRQGAVQFEQWTGRPAPSEVFRRVMLNQLGASAGDS